MLADFQHFRYPRSKKVIEALCTCSDNGRKARLHFQVRFLGPAGERNSLDVAEKSDVDFGDGSAVGVAGVRRLPFPRNKELRWGVFRFRVQKYRSIILRMNLYFIIIICIFIIPA